MTQLRVLSVLLVLPVAMIAGCPSLANEKEILAGTWELQTIAPGALGISTLEFSTAGNLTRVVVRPAEGVEVVDETPVASTSVLGDEVTISTNVLLIGTLTFTGTLNDDATVATGELTTNLNFGLFNINIDSGQATLTRVD